MTLPGRDEAREAVRRELSDPRYDEAKPPLTYRALEWLLEQVQELLSRAAGATPGGTTGLLLLALLLALLVAVVVVRLRPSARAARARELFGPGPVATAAEHRAAAEAAAARGDFALAVRERLRAVVRELEQRGLLDPRPARTAAEVVAEVGTAQAALAEPLGRAVRTFEQVWYGGQEADASSYQLLVEVDALVGRTRLVQR